MEKKSQKADGKKRKYRTPTLLEYGTIKEITKNVAGPGLDGGNLHS